MALMHNAAACKQLTPSLSLQQHASNHVHRCTTQAPITSAACTQVAIRLGKKMPKGTDYRAMSVFTHFYSRPKYRLKIPRTKYFPVPGVDGALVTFALIPPASRPKVGARLLRPA
jgi:16S rRNA A1518/A1519 N6-dimethyltransferase RsmA/KsgA/DIM1 with predicted DNA glycosylase/AP lyase activity